MKTRLPIYFVLIVFMIASQKTIAQLNTYTFEQIDSLQKSEKRKVLIFIHTSWCKYCQAMQNTTFKDKAIINMLNNQFYFVDLDGEERRNILFNNHIFKYKPSGVNTGTHELAEQLGTVDEKLSFPTICVLNHIYEIIFQYPQHIKTDDFLDILKSLK